MFGCFGKFIKIIIIILAIIGFVSIGGVTFFKDIIKNPFASSQATKMKHASKIADFSKLDTEFESVSAGKIPKLGNYVYVKHGVSSQNFYLVKPVKAETLSKKDFADKSADEKISSFVQDMKIFKFENFEITDRGSINALGQTIPYVKFKSDIVNFPINGIEGIIGVADDKDGNIIVAATNTNGKYSQIITSVFLKQLR